MLRNLILIGLLATINFVGRAQTTLAAGDLLFTSFNTTSNTGTADTVSFVLLVPITANTVIYFSDRGFQNPGWQGAGTTEGVVSWTSGTALAIGAEVQIAGLSASVNGVANGSIAVVSGSGGILTGGLSLGNLGDQIMAFQGAAGDPTNAGATYIAGINWQLNCGTTTDANWNGGACVFGPQSSYLPTGLTNGFSSMLAGVAGSAPGYNAQGKFNCSAGTPFSTVAALRTAVLNKANWTFSTTTTGSAFDVPPGCTYYSTCTNPTIPTLSASPTAVCSAATSTITITGTLNSATSWRVYTGSCGGTLIGSTATSSFNVNPTSTTTYFIRGEGGCVSPGSCGSVTVTVNPAPATPGAISGTTTICSGTTNTYSVTAVPGATSYTWTLPGGWTGASTTNSITATASATSGNISVTANNTCGSSASSSQAITVNTAPATPGVIAGTSPICAGSSNTYSVTAVPGATSYTWTLPGGWTGTSTTNSITTTASATSGNISVTANNSCGSSASSTRAITVNSAPATPGAISGTTTICSGSSNTYSVTAVPGATSYTWTLPGGWTGTSTTNSITAVASATSGNITVTASNTCGTSGSSSQAITVNTTPATPGAISGTTTICSGSSNTYSVTAVPGATSYTWTLPGGWTGTSTTNSITATASATSGNISVTASNACGTSGSSSQAITVTTAPATPGAISGTTAVCAGTSYTYSITAVPGAIAYTWTLPFGWTGTSTTNSITTTASNASGNITVTASNACGTSGASSQAVTTSTGVPGDTPFNPIPANSTACVGQSVTYSFAPSPGATSYIWTFPGDWTGSSTTNSITLVVGATSGTVTATPINACGSSPFVISTNVTVSSLPATPGAISGTTTICSGTSNTYSVTAVPGATTYTWTLPGGWTGTTTTNSITTTASATSGNISVTANNSCGSSAPSSQAITVNSAPATPGVISGTSPICSGSSNTYSVTAVPGATSYTWTLPGGWTGTSTTNSITTTASATSGNISVTASNTCGTSASSTRAITVNSTPATPGAISGTTTICSGSSNTYNVTAVPGATSYTWTLPGGWTGTSTTNSITTTASATSGNISVTASNTCGTSGSSSQAITVNTTPATPGTISGTTTICSGTSNTYSVTAVPGATTYTWTLPGGWTGTSTTNSITTTASATSGNISVTANNSCGSSGSSSQAITVNSAPATPGAISGTTTVCSGSSNTYSVTAVPGATAYTWTLPGGWTGTSTTNSITTTAGSTGGNISVTADNSCGSSGSSSQAITVPSAIVLTIASQTNETCGLLNAAVSVNAATGGSGGYTYDWTPGTPTGDGTTSITGIGVGVWTCTVTDATSCTASVNATITNTGSLDNASFNYSAASYCANDADPTPTITGLPGGSFSSTPGLSINASTGVIDLSASTPATYTVTYLTAGPCPNSTMVSVTILGSDNASFSYSAAAYCLGQADPTPTITGLAGGTFSSSPAGLSINPVTGFVNIGLSIPGAYTITYTTAGTCPNSSNASFTVSTPPASPSVVTPITVCPGADIILTATGSGTGSILFINSVPTLLGTVPMPPATATFNAGGFAAGVYTFGASESNGTCQSLPTLITVNVSDVTPPTAVCQNFTTFLSAFGTATITAANIDNGSSDNCGAVTLAASTTTFTCANLGANNVTLTVTDASGNTSTCVAVVTVSDNLAPVPNVATLANVTAECSVTSLTAPTATDNCAGAITVTNNATLPITAQGTTVVTWTYTDASGNSSTQTQNVVIDDVTAPVPTVATLANVTAECSVTSLTAPTATDNCGGSVTVTNNATLPITTQGTTVVTWTYNDGNGNTSTQTQNVVIDDVTAPVPNVATLANVTAECSVTSLTAPTATDNCAGVVTVTNNATLPITTQGTTVVTWTYNDGNGNASTQTQNVVIDDVTAPVPNVATLANVTAECSVTSLTAPTATDNCAGVVTVTNNATLPITTQGTTVVTWTYNDGNGNTSTQTQNVVIDDITSPVPNAATLADITAECSVASLTAPTATDNCAGVVTVTNNATLPITTQGTTVVTWTYNDGNGNTSTQTQNVVIDDITAPVPTLATLANVTAECSVTSLTAPTATDNCAGVVTVTNNATLPITTQGTTVVTWTYNDGNGNTTTQTQNVVIDDITAPVPTVATLSNVTAECSVTSLTAPTATDNCAGVVTVTNNATLPITTQGTTVVTWTYNDGNGNTSTQTQNVVIDDVTAPVPTLATLVNVTAECSVASLTSPTATDNCAGVVTVTNNATLPITTQGTTVVTWTYNDGNGNTSTQTQNVIIDDITAPVPNVATLANVTAECSVASLTAPTATDNCAGVVTVTNNATLPITTQGTTVVTWTYNDGNGNTSTQTQNVIIDDITAPVPTLATLPNVTAECSVTSLTAPTATDNCAGVVTVTNNATLPIAAQGTTVVTWTYNDGNGNTTTQTQNVVIDDNTAPVPTLATLANVTAECSVTSLTAPTATDNCGGSVTVTNNATLPITTQGTTVITWTYTDVNGNSSTQTQNVVIDDITAPVPTVATLTTITAQCAVTSLTAPTATDNCAGVVTVTNNVTLPITTQGTTVVTWTYNDGNGNTSTQTQNVVIDDITAPVPTLATLPDVTAECSVTALIPPTATDNCAGVVTVTNNATLPISAQGTTVVTWTYDDGNGNTTTQTQNVVLLDVSAPLISAALPTVTDECSVSLTAPIGNDACVGPVTGTTTTVFPITTPGTTIVIWSYSDGRGNISTQTQVVVIDDVTAPVPDLATLPDVTAVCSINSLTPPTATDNCNGVVTVTSNAILPITVLGTTVVTWTYTDAAGNTTSQTQNIILTDVTGPVPDVATLPNAVGECSIVLTAPTATDGCDGLTVSGTTTDPLSYSAQGTYTVTWTYTDVAGNTSTQNQTVIVSDVSGPVPNAATLAPITAICSVTPAVPSATDNCDGSITGTTTTTFPITSSTVITWSYADGNGNITTQTQTVTITGVDVTTSLASDGVEITANNGNGDSYQWIDCATNAPVANGTNQSYTATVNGSYAVIINENGCIDTSACVTIVSVGMSEVTINDIVLYPNPTEGMLFISYEGVINNIEIVDMLGRVINAPVSITNKSVDADALAPGKYLMRITTGNSQTLVKEFVVQL